MEKSGDVLYMKQQEEWANDEILVEDFYHLMNDSVIH